MELATKAVIFDTNDSAAMNSRNSASLHKIIDKTVLEYMIGAIKKAGIVQICVVSSGYVSGIERITKNEDITYVVQNENQPFTELESFLEGCGQVVVLNSDMPLLCSEGLAELIHEHKKYGKALSCASLLLPTDGLSVSESQLIKYDPAYNESQYSHPQIYCFDVSKLISIIKNNSESANLFYKAFEVLAKTENEVSYYTFKNAYTLYKIKNRMDLITATGMLSRHIANNHINNGVTIIQPETTYIGADVEIGIDAVIYPGVSLEGKTKIGENCIIGYNSRIVNSTISHDTEVFYSTILDSFIGSETHVGPYAYVRPNSKIGNNVKIGDFVEIKNSSIGNNTKVSHLTYVGDADVGEDVNFGCGTVTVNYDGEKKYRATIHDKAFIGCNTNLVSPVEVGSNAYIAAGSTITDNVPENSLAIARCRQTIKPEWRIKRKVEAKRD